MNQLTTVGIDLAKDVFAVCVLDVTGAVIERRDAFIKWAERPSPCRVAMEARGSAHHWGWWFSARGHGGLCRDKKGTPSQFRNE
jgi:transposase